jgi:hypothetical protein
MSNLHIDIKRPYVIRLVAMESAYIAVKRADADALCDTVPIVEADDEILIPMWKKSCARLLSFLRLHLRRKDGFVLSAQFDVNGFRANLSLPFGEGRGGALSQVLNTALTAYLTKDILAAWLSMALPEREPSCRAEADEILLSLERLIASYRHPMRVRKRMEVV